MIAHAPSGVWAFWWCHPFRITPMIEVTIKFDQFGFIVVDQDGFAWAAPTLAAALTEAIEILNEG